MKKAAEKAFYAMIGAPLVVRDRVKKVGSRFAEATRTEYDAFATEGEKFAKNVRESEVVEEISSRMDLEHLQGRVEKMRDQLEEALAGWRDSFKPEEEAAKPAAKTTAAKKAPAAKTNAAKKAPAKKAPAKAGAAK